MVKARSRTIAATVARRIGRGRPQSKRNRSPRPWRWWRWRPGSQRPAVGELPGVRAVANKAGAVRQQLLDRGPGNIRVQVLHEPVDSGVEVQAPAFPELEDSGRREGLRMRGDAKAVARRQPLASQN